MLLSSSLYFFFLIAVFFLYWPFSRWRATGLAVLLFANYFFYAKWDIFYLALIPLASSVDYAIGLALGRAQAPRLRKFLVTLSVLSNLGILAAFKYAGFFLESWAQLTGQTASKWEWTFPLGISFYCFQSLTYTIDIYRRDAKPTQSYLAHLTAVSFFPTTLAGPITRVSDLLRQLEKPGKSLDAADGSRGLFLIGLGLMKKLLIADYLAENLVNRVFDFPGLYSGGEVLTGVYAYAFQLYYDFSGYTDIALGSALLLGLKLPINFNQPYSAANINDFWRRWHISLSNWLRDYLFFSLPGKRNAVMPYINLVITMTLGGLWHGASWNFVIWGVLHGAGQAVSRFIQAKRGKAEPRTPAWWRTFITVQFVCFCWIYFRANSLEQANLIVERIVSNSWAFDNVSAGLWTVLALAVAGHYAPKSWLEQPRDLFIRSPFFAQATVLLLLAIAIQYVAATGAAPFIYTKF
ncbi:MAG TPA: MBOAT family O-acyltransferase [Bryobacteraceae bacterium]|nr:MBOAT family O-acyltransferase [Bryobacteraceae bacterium]